MRRTASALLVFSRNKCAIQAALDPGEASIFLDPALPPKLADAVDIAAYCPTPPSEETIEAVKAYLQTSRRA